MTLSLPSKKIFVLRSISCPSSLFLSCLTSLSLFYPSCLTFPFIPYISLTILSIVPYCSFHSLRHSHHSIHCTLLFLSCLMSLSPFYPSCLTVPYITPYVSLTILSILPYCSYHALRHSHHSIHCVLLFLSCLVIPIVPLFLLGISFSKPSLPSIVHTDNELTFLHQVADERLPI